MNFSTFKNVIKAKFDKMQKEQLFRTKVTSDDLWGTYLQSFPEGSNPTFKERTEHDCQCCRNFVKNIGDVVTIDKNGKIDSIWDVEINGEPEYQAVADGMSVFIHAQKIDNIFLHYENTAGSNVNYEFTEDKNVHTFEHFYVKLAPTFTAKSTAIGSAESVLRSSHDVLSRALNEIDTESVDTVLELIANNSLYRGNEHLFAVKEFQKLQDKFRQIPSENKDAFVWHSASLNSAVSNIRNSVIGSLLTDLSDGRALDEAVASFEAKVAPSNYKRPTALVTNKMKETAALKIAELGLESSLNRRYANINDITIDNILFADRSTKKKMGVLDSLLAPSKQKPTLDKIEEVSIEHFLKEILPKAESLEVMMDSGHIGNLVSLIAPDDNTSPNIFKWNNRFSWSYNGEVADSIKERVKNAGGNVSGDLCCRLGWYNTDDLDFQMIEPNGGMIYFGHKKSILTKGQLDVDMNMSSSCATRDAVENIFYRNRKDMVEGTYTLEVKQFNRRESVDVGFDVEIDYMGDVMHFSYEKACMGVITVAKFKYTHKDGFVLLSGLPPSKKSKTEWNVQTNAFSRVIMCMHSPNYWGDNGVGNKHYFFMLEDCKNDKCARGFFNEFLKEEYTPHRKVFELIGSKMKAESADQQLSGLGFSSTQRNSIICKVTGSFSRTIKITF